MFRWIVKLLLNAGALLLISSTFEDVQVAGYGVAIVAALILGIVNTLIRPILLLITLPLHFLTMGLFWFVINALTFTMTAYLVPGFELGEWPDSFWTTVLAAATMSLLAAIIDQLLKKE